MSGTGNPMRVDDDRLCGAKTRSGGSCRRVAMANGRCDMHGGKSLSGIAAPAFKHGRYSKHLPARMAERYQASLDDPDALNLRQDVALVDARLNDLLSQVDTGESGRRWGLLKDAADAYQDASTPDDQKTALRRMLGLIQAGFSDHLAWQDIGQALEQRRKLVDTEAKRLNQNRLTISVERGLVLMGAMVQIVRNHVKDPHVLGAIADEFEQLTIVDG